MIDFIQLKRHQQWLKTAGRKGKRLFLDGISMKDWRPEQLKLLENSYLVDCDFSGMLLEGIDFYSAELYSCIFRDTQLKNVEFTRCELSDSDFSNATLEQVGFLKTEGIETVFNGTIFENTAFTSVFFSQADFRNCRIKNASFDHADLWDILILEEQLDFFSNLTTAHSVKINIGTKELPKIVVLK